MEMLASAAALGLLSLGLTAGPALAAADPQLILINNGINEFVLGDHKMMAVRSWRDNGNAHGFDVVSFYETGEQLNLVPLFSSGNDKEKYQLTVSGGADCVLHDFRLLKAAGKKPAQLIIADRDLSESYLEDNTVHFTYYDLVEGDRGAVGAPPLSFVATKNSVARHKFCDVNDAFDKELRLGPGSQAER
jgi:hypothetical protein